VELRHLRYAVAIAEEGSFTRAALRLHLAQQALSQQIADLERELQIKLFERSGRGAWPTAAGAAFLEDARLTLGQSERAVARARAAARGEVGTLRLGICRSFHACDALIAEALGQFHRRFPSVDVDVTPVRPARHLDALRHGLLDVAVGHGQADVRDDIAGQVIWDEPWSAVLLPASHPGAGTAPLWVRDLADLPLLAGPREAGPALLDQVVAALGARGLKPRIAPIRIAGMFPELAAALVAACPAWRLMVASDRPRYARMAGVQFRTIADDPIPLSLWVLWRQHDPSPILSQFVAICREVRQLRRRGAEGVVPVSRVG
jgi:DNA-binding transcriptional LysR family regulator